MYQLPASTAAHGMSKLRDALAEALMRWSEGNKDPRYAHLRRPAIVRENAYGRADAALGALTEHLDLGDAEAWCKVCRRVWEGPEHLCASDAEQRLARARELHQETCPLAKGVLRPPAFTCSMCEALESSVEQPSEDESEHADGCPGCENFTLTGHIERTSNVGALERVQQLHDQLAAESDLASPDDEITRGAAARKIAAALDGWTPPWRQYAERPCHKAVLLAEEHIGHVYRFQGRESFWCTGSPSSGGSPAGG